MWSQSDMTEEHPSTHTQTHTDTHTHTRGNGSAEERLTGLFNHVYLLLKLHCPFHAFLKSFLDSLPFLLCMKNKKPNFALGWNITLALCKTIIVHNLYPYSHELSNPVHLLSWYCSWVISWLGDFIYFFILALQFTITHYSQNSDFICFHW